MRLPPELWKAVCYNLAPPDLRNLLFVSHLTHQFALELLFSTLNVHIIPEHNHEVVARDLHHSTEPQVEQYVYHTSRLSELIIHIGSHPSFARVIRTLRVHALGDKLFELLALSHAISLLPNLRALHWFHTDLPSVIAASLPPTLHTLHFPKTHSYPSLAHLHRLREILLFQDLPRFLEGYITQSQYIDIDPPQDKAALNFLSENSNTLTKVALSADLLLQLPIRLFDTLTEIEIYCTGSISHSVLDLICRHATNITTLTLIGTLPLEYFATLASNTTTSLHLRSLCIIQSENLSTFEEMLEMLSSFIKTRTHLKRLFFYGAKIRWDTIINNLLPSIGSLKSLKTLGLMSDDYISTNHVRSMCLAFPNDLDALHMGWSVDKRNAGELEYAVHHFVAELPRLQNLRFLSASSPNEYLPYGEVASLVSDLRVEVVALDGRLWNISRSNQGEVLATQWSDIQVESCTPMPWFPEDYYWLLRYAGEPATKSSH